MWPIVKGVQPESLTNHQATPASDWDGYREKQEAREYLCREQNAICAFCYSRIEPTDSNLLVKSGVPADNNRGIRIAHWMPKTLDPSLQLKWSNLLASCNGGEGSNTHHCDVSQKNDRLNYNPVASLQNIGRLISFHVDGEIVSIDPNITNDIKVLNLNAEKLKKKRRDVINGFKDAMVKRGTWSSSVLERKKNEWATPVGNLLREFAPVVIYYIEKKI